MAQPTGPNQIDEQEAAHDTNAHRVAHPRRIGIHLVVDELAEEGRPRQEERGDEAIEDSSLR
eukprot:CAMPEP_0118860216 /NCGR_PEP_ID=MMETSP1163-20130328/6149_1 /TAXON_ID=124430 /ORGANISM="Phaeomonas parva, Strain CCMP2877" /LENGTH=61 /DNA_ID=CAMNT_0006793885 /DNA_START=150 /DNA_END=331 /DNA_ORIENTATION=-